MGIGRSRRLGAGMILMSCVLLIAGCSIFNPKKNDTPKQTSQYDRTTPVNTMAFYGHQMDSSTKDITNYGRALHPNYLFHFTTQDAQNMGPGFPGFWTKEEDVASTQDMFNGAISIHMQLTPTGAAKDTVSCTGNPGDPMCIIYEVTVDLAVEVPRQPENITYLVHGLADMAFTKDPTDANSYVIDDIVDRTAATEPSGSAQLPAQMLLSNGAHVQAAMTSGGPVVNTTWGGLLVALKQSGS